METVVALGSNKKLQKAKVLYRAILYLTAFTILMALLLPTLKLEGTIRDLTISLPALLAVAITPVGFFFLLKSYLAKEPYKKQKLLYLVGYGFFITLFVLFAYAVAVDIAKLL